MNFPYSSGTVPVSTLGTPRIGPRRELKAALEDYWAGRSDAQTLLDAAALRRPGRAFSTVTLYAHRESEAMSITKR